ncbi:uncharacterized protein LOC110888709 [Helianthus annuus]|uniref:uncharacterized protein LOC110888709 n=1 Tax=Helianthus annuus TaxID=4232 RepID=UPI000B8FE5A5|nr:uncharacterized protein LOC110888709 [Helianthus annuus]
MWKLVLGCIASKAELAKRGVHLADTRCSTCGIGKETVNHIVVLCMLVRSIWWQLCVWTKIPVITQAESFSDMLNGLHLLKGSSKRKKIMEVILAASIWSIWKARNTLRFKGEPFIVSKVVDAIKEESFLWIKNRTAFSGIDRGRWMEFNV